MRWSFLFGPTARSLPNGAAAGRTGVAVLLALGAGLVLAGCTAPHPDECGAGSACALTVPVPTSTAAAHTDGQLTGLLGTLDTTSRDGRLCIALREDDGSVLALVLPPGTSAAVTSRTPPDGRVLVTLIGANGFGGARSGDRVAITPDKRQGSAKVGGCSRGPVVSAGWLIRLPSPTPSVG